jgi:hypothetical protein
MPMRTRLLHRFFFAAALLVPSAALAQNGSTPGSLELYPTFEAIGARLSYTGDANGNATARLEWRAAGAAGWTPGHEMTRITDSRWAASVLWLSPSTAYEVRAVIEDPDGGGTSPASPVTTRSLPPATPSGRTWWVATNGSDSNDGSSGAPLATLSAAAGKASAGDEIRVRPGIYYQTLDTPKAGTAAAPIHLVADGPGVILDGSDPALLNRTDWRSDGGGIYSIPYTPTSNRLVCADSLMRLYLHGSLSDLQSNANGMTQGFAISGGRLYVKLEDGSNPSAHVMHVARYNVGILIDSAHWHVRGFEVRYFGTTTNAAGIQMWSSNAWIENNHIHTVSGRAIFMRLGASNNLIEQNLVRDPRVGDWPWEATKAHAEEITGISNRGGRGNVIRDNVVRGFFDGLDANVGDTDENIAADADYYRNLVTGCGDDAIETDTISGINLRLWDNTFVDNFSGISVAPIYQGPEYILYNVVTDYDRSAFKFSLGSTGVAWFCHNTATTRVAGKPAVWPSGNWSNMHFRNNILVGNGLPTVNDDAGESLTGNDFDHDLLHVTSTSTLFRWKGTNYSSLSALRSGTGFEANGRSGDPLFSSASTNDYRLEAGSPAIDIGLVMPGINDLRYSGPAPDAGAFEFASTVPDTVPPAAIQDLR